MSTPERREPAFVAAQSRTLAEAAAERLRERIMAGELAPGERLPSERELVEELGVSRTVLREALSSLEALGMIEARTTRGRYVAEGGSSSRAKSLVHAWLYQHVEDIAEIDEIRALLEAQAVRSMSPEDAYDAARRARAVLADQEAAIERDDSLQAARCDADFHRLLIAYSRNGALRSLAEGLIGNTKIEAMAVYALPDVARTSLEQHTAVVEALAAGDVERASDLARDHMLAVVRRYAPDGEEVPAR